MKLCNLFNILFNILFILCDINYVKAEATSITPINASNDIVISYENECRTLCESCDCKGFFCGDNECICECNANINLLNKYAECLKDIIKDNFYKYNISVQHLNVSSTDVKKSEEFNKSNKMIRKRSIVSEMHPESTNFGKEKIFMADSTDFKFPPLNLDFVGSPFGALKGIGESFPGLTNLGKVTDVAAPGPSILAAPAKDQVAAAPPPVVAAPVPALSVSTLDTPVGSPNDDANVGIAALKTKGAIKGIEIAKIGKITGLLGKIKGIKLKSLVKGKGGLLGDAADVGSSGPIITQPAQTR